MKKQVYCTAILAGLVFGSADASAQVKFEGIVHYNGPQTLLFAGDFNVAGNLFATGGDSLRVVHVDSGEKIAELQPTLLPRRLPPMQLQVSEWIGMLGARDKRYLTRVVKFSPAGEGLFATGGDDGSVKLWNLSVRQPLITLPPHKGSVRSLVFSPSGQYLVSAAYQRKRGSVISEIRIWDLMSNALVYSDHFYNDMTNCITFVDERTLLFALNDGKKNRGSTIEFFDLPSRSHTRKLSFSPGGAHSISLSKDGKRLVIAGGECLPLGPDSCKPTGYLWLADANSDDDAVRVEINPEGYFSSTSWIADKEEFVVTTSRHVKRRVVGQLQLRSSVDGKIVWSVDSAGSGSPHGASVSPNGKHVAYCSGDRKVNFLAAETGELVRSIQIAER